MYPIITLIVVLHLALLMARIATRALVHTGLSAETARFQSWSALSGVGFTTSEAESVVNHPVRRHLVMVLMLVGNVGIITIVSSFILAFVEDSAHGWSMGDKVLMLAGGSALLWFLGSSRWVDRRLKRLIDRFLDRYTSLGGRDYDSLLDLPSSYRVAELFLKPTDWLTGQSLGHARIRQEGLNVLGVHRSDGTYEGNMSPDTILHAGDTVVIYGRLARIEAIDQRITGGEGDQEHEQALEKSIAHKPG